MATESIEINLPDFVGKVFSYSEIDSTQAEAKRKIVQNCDVPFLVIAKSQTSGVGRFRRQWYSPAGGIYFTLATKPARNPAISLVVGIALVEILKDIAPDSKFILKWPNDILADGEKIAGILAENFDDALLIGIGINTFQNGEFHSIPCDENRQNEILLKFFKKLGFYLDKFDLHTFQYFLPQYIKYTIPIGTEIEIFTPNNKIIGFFSGITDDGRLILENDGEKMKFLSGEVSLRIGRGLL